MEPAEIGKLIGQGKMDPMSAPADVLDAARSGDAEAFERLVGPYRGELLAHCYRMLGSLHDAEDAVQESLVRAWRSVGRLDDRGFVRAWLYKIATNRCLTALDRHGRRELPFDVLPGTADTEISWLEPYPAMFHPRRPTLRGKASSSRSSRRLQHLSALQRAVLILREVLGFSAAAVAEQLDTSTASVNSALQRARNVIDTTGVSQQSVLRDLGQDGVEEIVTRWINAWQAGDVDAIVAMLTDDARFSMPPLHEWYLGPSRYPGVPHRRAAPARWRFLPTSANGQLAFGTYLWDDATGAYMPGGLDVLTIQNGRVAQIVAFLSADLTELRPAREPAGVSRPQS